ncbi:hypothetical protein L950_0202820 [Sphingobacterium sp. IITKGP-BTPF85]|nr:hypothetical protein L950_0202820 [Sphingobacterium sp. IITKGP-BTPF85]
MDIAIYIILSLIVGIAIGRYLLALLFSKQTAEAQEKVKSIIKEADQEAEHLKKKKLLEAKEKFLQLKSEHEKEVSQRNNTISQKENTLRQKEQSVNQKLENLNREKQELDGTRNSLKSLLK